jgi:hypothetical protein
MRQPVDLATLSDRSLRSLRRIIERRESKSDNSDIVPESLIPACLERYAPGNVYGAYHETILSREVRRDSVPSWFDPITVPGHFGIITADGYRCYLVVDVNQERRDAPSTFETLLLTIAEDEPTQLSLM